MTQYINTESCYHLLEMNSIHPLDFIETEDDLKLREDSKFLYSDSSPNLNDSEAEPKQIVLIKLIENEPAIFDPKHEDYRSNAAKDILWANISKRVGWTERFCKRKWKALRDQYCRELKRIRSNSKAVIKWKYFHDLEFLRPYALHREYRLKLGKILQRHAAKEHLELASDEKVANNKLVLELKPETWNSYNEAGQLMESVDVASQLIEQITQSDSIGVIDEDPQDDDDDDPIHTFLRIESYFEKKLITLVESEDVLYNFKNPLYRNPKLKMTIWEEIARKLKKTSIQCRLKWKSLRDQYIREYKRILTTNSGSFMPRWKHYDSLRFLENFIKLKTCSVEGSFVKEELDISIEHLDHEALNTPSPEAQYIIGDEDTTQTFADCGNSKESAEVEEDSTSYTLQNDTQMDLPVEELSEGIAPAQDDNDEVGSFFKAVAIKIRNANMSTMAFTELQIDILKVITNALRNP